MSKSAVELLTVDSFHDKEFGKLTCEACKSAHQGILCCAAGLAVDRAQFDLNKLKGELVCLLTW